MQRYHVMMTLWTKTTFKNKTDETLTITTLLTAYFWNSSVSQFFSLLDLMNL